MDESLSSSPFLGRWKSGRKWKSAGGKLTRNIKSRGSGLKTWEEKVQQRQVSKLEQANKKEKLAAQDEAKKLLKRRREESKKRREENIKKAEITQSISNSRKIKRMKKKQLGKIRVNK